MPDIRDYNLNRWGFVDDSGTLITIASSNVSIDELNSILGTINIVPNDNNYVLMVNGREAGVISITSQLKLKNVVYNPDTQSIEFTFDSDEGEKKVSVDVHDLIDVYTAGQGLGVDKNQFFIKIDPSSEKYLSVSENGIKISGLDTLLKNLNETLANFGQETAKAFDQINNVLETSINTINGGIDNEIRPAITKNADDISAINEALLNKVEYTDVATSENPGCKAIVLKNHDVILGTTTTGQTNSLVMMSKWDKADFGSASVTLNLNGKDEHPTYNDNKEIAFVDDIPSVEGLASEEWVNAQGFLKEHQDISNLATKDEVALKANQSDVDFQVNALNEKIDAIKIPTKVTELENDAQYQTSSEVDDRIQAVVGAAPEALDTLEEIANKLSDNDDVVASLTTQIAEKATTEALNTEIETRSAKDTELQGNIEAEAQARIAKDTEIETELANKVAYTDVATEENPNLKAIVLNNYDTLLGNTTSGSAVNIAMVSKWDKVDLGSTQVSINLNGKDKRPTYNDDAELALLSDVQAITVPTKVSELENDSLYQTKDEVDAAIISKINTQIESLYQTVNDLKSNIPILSAKVELLESKVDNLEKSNSEVVETYDGSQELNNEAKVYSISNANITNNPSITAKSVILNDSALTNNARMRIKAENVNINNLQVTGDFPKSTSNSVININDTENIIFKDMTFNSSDVYNGIEIGLSSDNSKLPKNIIFDNCRFEGSFSNNAILIFGTQNNATITLNNCYFKKVSNALRLSNKSNASGVTVNIINCTVDEWDSNTLWRGFLICEDYTNTESEAQAEEANLFSPEKIKVNFINLIHNNEKILPSDIVSVCGSKDENQVVVVCIDAIQGNDYCINYDANKFPTITFE